MFVRRVEEKAPDGREDVLFAGNGTALSRKLDKIPNSKIQIPKIRRLFR